MPQTKVSSLLEAIFNNFIGFFLALGMNYLVLPLYGFNPPILDNVQIVIWFTLLSIARSYCIRRMWVSHWWKVLFRK